MSQKQRIGIIGAGWWAAVMHIPTLVNNSSAEIAGICATDSSALKKLQDLKKQKLWQKGFETGVLWR